MQVKVGLGKVVVLDLWSFQPQSFPSTCDRSTLLVGGLICYTCHCWLSPCKMWRHPKSRIGLLHSLTSGVAAWPDDFPPHFPFILRFGGDTIIHNLQILVVNIVDAARAPCAPHGV